MSKLNIKKYEIRFSKAKGVIEIPPPQNKPTDPYLLAYSAALHLLVRTKYLFLAIIHESKKRNTYAGFVLVRSFFETCMALGYLAIKLDKKSKTNDIEGVWQLSHRILQGGKHFPASEYRPEVKKENVPAINIYDYLDEVDKDYRRIGGKETTTPHREVYDTILSEFGHPNFLGLITCSWLEKGEDDINKELVGLSRSCTKGDKNGYFIYLDWGSAIFFHYWDKLFILFEKFGLNLPSLK